MISGLARACRENTCALVGGEMAELPDVYHPGEYDLAGVIVGLVGQGEILDGARVREGDVLLGLASTGLHTNGYSLARKIVFHTAGLSPNDILPGEERTVADALLAVHRPYGPSVINLTGSLTMPATTSGDAKARNIFFHCSVNMRMCVADASSNGGAAPRGCSVIFRTCSRTALPLFTAPIITGHPSHGAGNIYLK